MGKRYYVIQNRDGKFFSLDSGSGGYPNFCDDYVSCEKYSSKQAAEEFLQSHYAREVFVEEFAEARIRTVNLVLE